MPATAPNCLASCSIWTANSRVGAMTSTAGGPRKSAPLSTRRANAGKRNAKVFPEPVLAMPIKSRPRVKSGQACLWIIVGDGNPAETNGARTRAGNSTFSHSFHGPGKAPVPRTSTSCTSPEAAGAPPLPRQEETSRAASTSAAGAAVAARLGNEGVRPDSSGHSGPAGPPAPPPEPPPEPPKRKSPRSPARPPLGADGRAPPNDVPQ
mmetsp:Transcript_33874/g.102360  ORF Transcript_33874/g.102360 Transcript_33874/m.102360 type:complete len:208 (+) Transcript_33874:55-678(+)